MMCRVKVISKTKQGILLFCNHSKMYQLLFKNVYFNLTISEFECFLKYIKSLNENYWKQEYENSIFDKYIPIPSAQENLMILLDVYELSELRTLVNNHLQHTRIITAKDIDYKIYLN